MGVGSAKRAAARAQDKTGADESNRVSTPVRARRAANRAAMSGESPFTTPKSSSKKSSGFTSKLPTDQQRRNNGRQSGRNLIIWSRPRMAEKLLLHIHYECSRHKIALPWDGIAHRLHPGSSGQAILQHINRVRKDVAVEGHLVPPIPTRPAAGRALDNKIRGYIRDEGSEDPNELRPVYFDEHVEDRKFGVPGAFVEDYDDAEDADVDADAAGDTTMDTPERFVKNESPQSPTPNGRQHLSGGAARRKIKSSPFVRAEFHHEGPEHSPAASEDEEPLDEHILDNDDGIYHSPAATRGRAPTAPTRGNVYQGQAMSFPYGQCRPASISAERLRNPAFIQNPDPFFGAGGLTHQFPGMDLGYDFNNMTNNLFSIPGMAGEDTSFSVRQPMQIGRAETLSPSGTHSQSSGTSFEDLMNNIVEDAGGSVKPTDLHNISKSA